VVGKKKQIRMYDLDYRRQLYTVTVMGTYTSGYLTSGVN
jgi:hypothetical protein